VKTLAILLVCLSSFAMKPFLPTYAYSVGFKEANGVKSKQVLVGEFMQELNLKNTHWRCLSSLPHKNTEIRLQCFPYLGYENSAFESILNCQNGHNTNEVVLRGGTKKGADPETLVFDCSTIKAVK